MKLALVLAAVALLIAPSIRAQSIKPGELADADIRELAAESLDAAAGGVGGWAMLAYAPHLLPPNPCFTALSQMTTKG